MNKYSAMLETGSLLDFLVPQSKVLVIGPVEYLRGNS
jgi:hypothetical protein